MRTVSENYIFTEINSSGIRSQNKYFSEQEENCGMSRFQCCSPMNEYLEINPIQNNEAFIAEGAGRHDLEYYTVKY